jgi:hypothetical protein
MGKFQVKVGVAFDSTKRFKFSFEVAKKKKKDADKSAWSDWKTLAVIAVFILTASAGAVAVTSGDYALFDKVMATIATVARRPEGHSGLAAAAGKSAAATPDG